jgi:DNA-binding response OmpR family regulator
VSKVCVVDDDGAVLQLLGRTLRDHGLDVDLLDQGARVLERARATHYDLILLDLGLPDMDGVNVLQTLRAADPEVRVIVVSARDDCANRVRCLDLGACDFVGKPFEIPELLARVRVGLRTSGRGASGYLGIGDLRLDLVRHCLVLHGRTTSLPTREFLLLKYLMDKSGEVCRREELLAAVWGYDFQADGNVVDVYISRLRAKIPNRLIETVRHEGYVFAAT